MESSNIAERLANLSSAKRALLEQRLKEESRASLVVQSIPRRASREFAPLSFAQQRLWFLNRLDPESFVYNEARAVRLTGVLDVTALEKSLNYLIARHEVLRTVIVLDEGSPVQRVTDERNIELPVIDLRGRHATEREAESRRLINQTVRCPFDLSRDLTLRVLLLRLEEKQHILLLVKHHIASDGWSSGIFWQEITALYRAYSSGEPPYLRELPIQYADYAVWQREWFRGGVLENQISYWREQLENLAPLQLPTDHPRPAIQTFHGARRSLTLPKNLSVALKALSREEGVTLFMLLLAAFSTLLSRYTGQEDIAVGSPVAGRNRAETEELIGFFVNTLVLRTVVSGSLTFRKLLERVRAVCLDAYSHQDLPFEKLVDELQPQRSLSHNPLFQVTFQLNNVPRPLLKLPAIEVEDLDVESEISKFDLSLSLSDRGEDISGRLQYNTDLFDESTINRMLGHFQVLLEGIVADPDRRIPDLPILTEAEKHQLLVKWNETKTDYPKDKCIHQLFEDQVERTPDAVALVFQDQQLSYRELNRRANQLAHYLINQGMPPESAVSIYLDRSIELAVALLAVLKAGGIYVPIDPSHPKERATFILQDVQARFVVTSQALEPQVSLAGARNIALDTELPKLDRDDNPNLRGIGAQSPAYILYTSGSTGVPKGVVMAHRSLTNLISWQIKKFDRGLPARTLQFAALGFDVSIQEMFSTWCSGGSLYSISSDLRQDGSSLLRYIDTQSIERIFLPFIALQHFAEIAVNEDCTPRSLQEIITAGEQLRLSKPLRQFLDRLKNCRLYNQYGPTESHVVTEYTLNSSFQQEPDLPPIGRPIANTQIHILDAYLQPVPIGVSGELHVGGVGLACGYLNRSELTEKKFIPNPFNNDPRSRFYKTGDLARYLPDGNIEFIGRSDNQVKIRGYRIELGEIEAVLAQHQTVQRAVVVLRQIASADQRLVAYVVLHEHATAESKELRAYLKDKLPDYMVPSAFVFLDAMPLTPNGKLDRARLPKPELIQRSEFVAPRTPAEHKIASIWAELLGVDKVGVQDDFFELGGHSLLATRAVSRMSETLQKNISVRNLFDAPTIAELVLIIDKASESLENKRSTVTRVVRDSYRIE